MNSRSTSLATREMQIGPTMRYHYTLAGSADMKGPRRGPVRAGGATGPRQGRGAVEAAQTPGRPGGGCFLAGDPDARPTGRHSHAWAPALQRKDMCRHKHSRTKLRSSRAHNSPALETIQTSINGDGTHRTRVPAQRGCSAFSGAGGRTCVRSPGARGPPPVGEKPSREAANCLMPFIVNFQRRHVSSSRET